MCLSEWLFRKVENYNENKNNDENEDPVVSFIELYSNAFRFKIIDKKVEDEITFSFQLTVIQ